MSYTLSSDAQLFAAALAQVNVSVMQRTVGDIPVVVDRGVICKYTKYTVKINGSFYVREETEFRVVMK